MLSCLYFFFLVSNLALVKPEKTKAVENYLIQMARYGQLSGKVSPDGLEECGGTGRLNPGLGAGRWLPSFSACSLAEDWSLVLSTHVRRLTTAFHSSSSRSRADFHTCAA